jgi:hypothetical protein
MAQGTQSHRVRPCAPTLAHGKDRRAQIHVRVSDMGTKQEIAIGIALQTQVLKVCPLHNQLYCDEDEYGDEEKMTRAFAVAMEMVRRHEPYAKQFNHNARELMDLLSYTIGAAPDCCPDCSSTRLTDRSSEAFAFH